MRGSLLCRIPVSILVVRVGSDFGDFGVSIAATVAGHHTKGGVAQSRQSFFMVKW